PTPRAREKDDHRSGGVQTVALDSLPRDRKEDPARPAPQFQNRPAGPAREPQIKGRVAGRSAQTRSRSIVEGGAGRAVEISHAPAILRKRPPAGSSARIARDGDSLGRRRPAAPRGDRWTDRSRQDAARGP